MGRVYSGPLPSPRSPVRPPHGGLRLPILDALAPTRWEPSPPQPDASRVSCLPTLHWGAGTPRPGPGGGGVRKDSAGFGFA